MLLSPGSGFRFCLKAEARTYSAGMSDHLWPVTIIATRYGGIYEGGEWAAFPLHPEQVPDDARADDITCPTWWEQYARFVGVGVTPDAALADLKAKCEVNAGARTPYRLQNP